MLTDVEYEDLWIHNPHGIGSFDTIPGFIMPLYTGYVVRENMFEDYLDIFRGRNTRHTRPIVPAGGWYYDHPFFNADGTPILKKKPCIRYTLIGEACPALGANYFYDITQITGQAYLKAAYDASYNGVGPIIPWVPLHAPVDKLHKLLDLASRGVLLIDLFPFALTYTTPIRNIYLNPNGITDYFFNDNHNIYSITNRMNEINLEGICCENFKNQTNSVFVCPTRISYHLAINVNAIPPITTFPLVFTIGENSLRMMPHHFILEAPHNYFYHMIPAGTTISGIPLPLGVGGIFTMKVPRYICCAYFGAHTVPHSLFITNALL